MGETSRTKTERKKHWVYFSCTKHVGLIFSVFLYVYFRSKSHVNQMRKIQIKRKKNVLKKQSDISTPGEFLSIILLLGTHSKNITCNQLRVHKKHLQVVNWNPVLFQTLLHLLEIVYTQIQLNNKSCSFDFNWKITISL